MLPVAHRELAVAARRGRTTGSRVLSAGVAFAVALFMIATTRGQDNLGARVLGILTIILLIEALFAGVRYTADCISEEKREGTLGLLFLTPLSGLDVIVGKIVARAMPALYNLIAVMPIFALSLLFGGVTGAQVFWLGMVLLTAMVFSLCAGIIVSTLGINERKVLIGSVLLVAAFAFAPPVLWQAEEWLFGWHRFDWVLLMSPVFAFKRASAGGAEEAALACAILGAFSAGMLIYSAARVRKSFTVGETANVSAVRPEGRSRRVRQLLELNPMYWLVLRGRRPARWWWFAAGLVAFGIFGRMVLPPGPRMVGYIVLCGSYGLHLFWKFLLVEESVRRLNSDRRSGALELLLTTPLPPSFILQGQRLAARKLFAPVLLGLAAMNFVWMTEREFLRDLPVVLPCSIVLLYSDAQALIWKGMLDALRGERYSWTVMRTFFRIMLPPLAIIIFLAFGLGGMDRETAQVVFLVWTGGCIAYSLSLVRFAKIRLEHFRALAAGDKWHSAWVAGGSRARMDRSAMHDRWQPAE